jgi:hypothetical protein
MAAAPPDKFLPRHAGRPIRFLLIVLALWGGARAVISNSAVREEGREVAPPVAPQASSPPMAMAALLEPVQKIILKQSGKPPKPIAARPKVDPVLTAPIETGPVLGSYYGPIARGEAAGAKGGLKRVSIAPSKAQDRKKARDLYADLPLALNSSAPIFNMIPIPTASVPRQATAARTSAPPVDNSDVWRKKGSGQGAQDSWRGSAWAFWRNKVPVRALGSAGQLGGAQVGARIDRHFNAAGLPMSVYGRVSSALYSPEAPEAAVGLALRPVGGPVPISIGVERRIGLNRDGRDAFALVAVTGLYPTPVFGGLIAEGYAQGGMVGFSRADAFIDGRFSLVMPFDRDQRFRFGGSVAGGAQPGVSRLDVGPVFEIRAPVGHISTRLLVEWRQRDRKSVV